MLKDRIKQVVRWALGLLSAGIALLASWLMPPIHKTLMLLIAGTGLMLSLIRLRQEPPPAVHVWVSAEPAVASAVAYGTVPARRKSVSSSTSPFVGWGPRQRALVAVLAIVLVVAVMIWLKR